MPEVVAVQNLTRRFGEVVALDDVTFTLEGPRVIGILGPNGAGKSTLLDLLEGLDTPTSGSIRILGRPIDPYPRADVGVVLQRECTLDHVTVSEWVELFAAIASVDARPILENAGLVARADVPMQRLSGGEAQRLHLAVAIAHAPKLLFLDEPTAHLDPDDRRRLGDSIIAQGRERTVVLTTHDMNEAGTICDYLVFIDRGRVRATKPRAELGSVEDAFFEYCAARINATGERA
jgi:ABC-2 type transport system ATP-binding protein